MSPDTPNLKELFPSRHCFDLVTCYMSLHHFSNKELPLILREVRRILRPNGYLFIRDIDGEKGEELPN